MGSLLSTDFHEGDLAARYGGEEFVIILNHCDQHDAINKAEKVRHQIETLNPAQLQITTSIGVSTLQPGMQYDFERLFHAADQGVYQAKESGRNKVCFVGCESSN